MICKHFGSRTTTWSTSTPRLEGGTSVASAMLGSDRRDSTVTQVGDLELFFCVQVTALGVVDVGLEAV
jgi:hypothetical protein